MLAWPIRVGADGRLERTDDPVGSLLSVVRAMAASPASSWGHARWFGLQEVFEAVNPELQEQPAVADALNHALKQLGIHWVTVTTVLLDHGTPPGERRFRLTLKTGEDRPVHRSLSL